MMKYMDQIHIDSEMSSEDILRQNPELVAPQEIVDELAILTVTYYGFDSKLHQGQLVVHKKATADVMDFFTLAKEIEFPTEKVIPIAHTNYSWNDDISCEDNNSSGYNFRYIAGTTRLSKHSLGLAFDINPMQNPYIVSNKDGEEIFRIPKNSTYDIKTRGTLHVDHPLVKLLTSRGWIWGGNWAIEGGKVDYQHFELPVEK